MKYLSLFVMVLLSACTTIDEFSMEDKPEVVKQSTALEQINDLPSPTAPVVVAVYDFPDLTGQRRDKDGISSLSTAVTQGGSTLLIDALKNARNGEWFKVVERNRIDDLAKERQLVRQTREEYLGKDANKLDPMLFAGIILQGGIIGYDSNIVSGGTGARYLGIGLTTQYRKDQVVVALRAVSTNTGEIIMNVQVTKTILSTANDLSGFRYIEAGTKLVELESGTASNEAGTIAVKRAIEEAVFQLVKQGINKGYFITEGK